MALCSQRQIRRRTRCMGTSNPRRAAWSPRVCGSAHFAVAALARFNPEKAGDADRVSMLFSQEAQDLLCPNP
eukprot:4804776-Amphidinium_carterae.1